MCKHNVLVMIRVQPVSLGVCVSGWDWSQVASFLKARNFNVAMPPRGQVGIARQFHNSPDKVAVEVHVFLIEAARINNLSYYCSSPVIRHFFFFFLFSLADPLNFHGHESCLPWDKSITKEAVSLAAGRF